VGRRDKLIALSRERFAMPRAKIEAKLRRWMASGDETFSGDASAPESSW